MSSAATIGDVVVEEAGGMYYLAFEGASPPAGVGGFRSLAAAKDQARAVWNLRLLDKLKDEAGRMSLASESTTDRLLKALDGLTNPGDLRHEHRPRRKHRGLHQRPANDHL
ncbi:hypothetical protein [Paludisphaera sp.]|uniref:hypothetical protein n=1 Tax=Paludisphaera sp. TaxID=2017432 RepID=UPI00301C9CAE